MNIAGSIPLILGALWAPMALAHGPDGHGDQAAPAAGEGSVFVSWELQQAVVGDARSAEKMAAALQGMSGPQAAFHAMYGGCVARLAGVLGEDAQTHLLHQPGQTASYTAGETVRSNRAVEVALGWNTPSGEAASWSIDWSPEGEATVHREGQVGAVQLENMHVPMAEVIDGTLLLATVSTREQQRMFNPPYETARASAQAAEQCTAVAEQSSAQRKKAFKDWLKQVTSAD